MDNRVLERTARSICGQANSDFRLVIVYNDKPEISFTHENLFFLHFPYAEVLLDKISDWEERKHWYSPVFAERMMDKSRKIIFGCQKAKELGCTYLMGVDSDDLVSCKLAGFVAQHAGSRKAGWRVNKGYVYEEGAALAVKNTSIWEMNGSTHIIRKDLVHIPDFETDFKLFSYSLFQSHVYTFQRLIDFEKVNLDSLPFYGVVYLIHDNNYSEVKRIISTNALKLFLKKMIRGKIFTSALRREFGLYPINQKTLPSKIEA